MNRRRYLALCAGASVVSLAGCVNRGADDYETIEAGGATRQYLLDFPNGYDENRGNTYPLLIALHGGAGSARGFADKNGLVEMADREGVVVVHPDGKGLFDEKIHVWNTGYLDTRLSESDDYTFISQLVGHVIETHRIDPRRVYLVGHSNGGMITHELAARYPEMFAAAAPVAAPVGGYPCGGPDSCSVYTPPEPERPTSIITVQGTADKHVLYDGGNPEQSLSRRPRYDYSARQTLDWWREQNACTGPHAERCESEFGQIGHTVYSCSDKVDVEHLRFDGVGHFWGEFDEVVRAVDHFGETLADALWARLSWFTAAKQ
jgi:polyhydroxybutyrate depolymerase